MAGGNGQDREGDSTPFTSIVIFASVVASAVASGPSSAGSGSRRVYVFPSIELVLFCGVVYQLRAIERSIGSRKAAAVCALSCAAYACVCLAAGYVPWASVLAHWYAAALCVYYAADVPSAYTFRVVGDLRAGVNVLLYLAAALCVGLCMPEGGVGAAAGLAVGLLCRTRVVSNVVDKACFAVRGQSSNFRDCYVGLVRETRNNNNINNNNNNINNHGNNFNNNFNHNDFNNDNNIRNMNRDYYGEDDNSAAATLRRLRVEPDPAKVRELMGMGFDESTARNALSMCDNNVEAAVNRILNYN